MKTLLIDHFDSYTLNIYQLLLKLNHQVIIIQHDQMEWQQLEPLLEYFDQVVLSPGPGSVENDSDFGLSRKIFTKKIPVLGICLGMQGLGHFYGAKIKKLPLGKHGIVEPFCHQQTGLFKGLPSPFQVVRYHSLQINDLIQIGHCADETIMAIQHKQLPYFGVQFHPESICTEYGMEILKNFDDLTLAFHLEKKEDLPSILFEWQQIPKEPELLTNEKSSETLFIDEIAVPDWSADHGAYLFKSLFENSPNSVWLDSNGDRMARWSLMGSEGDLITFDHLTKKVFINQKEFEQLDNETFSQYLKRKLYLPNRNPKRQQLGLTRFEFDFNAGILGYFGYPTNNPQPKSPQSCFIYLKKFLCFDHEKKVLFILQLGADFEWIKEMKMKIQTLLISFNDNSISTNLIPKIVAEHPDPDHKQKYKKAFDLAQDKIKQGESYEICLTTEWTFASENISPFSLYLDLRRNNPAPFGIYFKFQFNSKTFYILSSSPERFQKVNSSGCVTMKPMKGTRKRGFDQNGQLDPKLDQERKKELQTSVKDRAENLMIVDLIRHDMTLLCDPLSVHVPQLLVIESYETVHQMVSEIQAQLRPHFTGWDLVEQCCPPGSMTGAPKIRTVEILEQLESDLFPLGQRGIYSGVFGWISLNGASDFSVIIRTVILEQEEQKFIFRIGAGGAITILSDFEEEYEEMLLKAHSVLPVVYHHLLKSRI